MCKLVSAVYMHYHTILGSFTKKLSVHGEQTLRLHWICYGGGCMEDLVVQQIAEGHEEGWNKKQEWLVCRCLSWIRIGSFFLIILKYFESFEHYVLLIADHFSHNFYISMKMPPVSVKGKPLQSPVEVGTIKFILTFKYFKFFLEHPQYKCTQTH